jgi:hypothetical protein
LAVLRAHAHAEQPLHPSLGGGAREGGVASVIGAAPQRYSAEQAEQRAALSALRREEAAAAAAAEAEAGAAGKGAARSRAPHESARVDSRSKAVAVEAVIANPSLQLPRERQERKDREKAKRERGQSAIGSWKSEAEMVLRQQYDS